MGPSTFIHNRLLSSVQSTPTPQWSPHLLSSSRHASDGETRLQSGAQSATEFIRPQNGHAKQDCETAAAKRWIEAYPIADNDVAVMLLGDDLYGRQPLCQTALEQGYDFIFVCLPTSHTELYEWLDYLERDGEMHCYEFCRYQGAKPLLDQCRYVNRVPLNAQHLILEVNCCEVTVIDQRQGQQLYFNTCVKR